MLKYIILILSITTVYSSVTTADQYDADMVKLAQPVFRAINLERADFDESPVTYDYDLHRELNLYPLSNGAGWCLQNNTYGWYLPYPLVGNLDNIRVDNCIFLMNYSTFDMYSRIGYRFLFSYKTDNKLRDILKNGRRCYDKRKCSKTEFTNYVSCIKPVTRCNAGNVYYPRAIEPSLTKIACVEDENVNYCYGKMLPYNTDSPFVT
jgi:hypothetical protein